jgi:tetratricopeptide (TPR) repeat protein
MMPALLLAAQFAAPARALTPFVEQLRKAEARDASDPERVEFATRALRAWLPEDGRPLLAHAHFARAEGEAALFDDAAAAEDLTKTLELDPRNERALLMRSRARAGLGRGAEAERDAEDYLSARRDDPEGWLALGEARLLQGPPRSDREARAAFAKAAKFADPGDPRPSLGEGRAFLSARRHREALASLSAAAERPQKRRAEILSWRSRAYSALGDWEAAHRDLTRALPDLERALDDRRRSGAAKPGQDAARAALADAYFRRGLANEALKAREPALADHRQACGLGLRPACARVASLEKPEPKEAPRPKAKKAPRRKNPRSDAGERIYAN